MFHKCWILLSCCLASWCSYAVDQTIIQTSDNTNRFAAKDWQRAAMIDLAGIHKILQQDHPAALPQVGDKLFIARLQKGFFLARQQAKHVTNYDEYRAVLNRYTASFNDLHIASYPVNPPQIQFWPGFIVNLIDGRWIVNDTAANLGMAWPVALPIRGMELKSCDGIAADDWAIDSVGSYLANWSLEAQRARYSSYLFIGEKGIKQFAPKPSQCIFKYKFQKLALNIEWQQWDSGQLRQLIVNQPVRASAGFGIERVGNGYWISFAALYGDIDKVVEQVEAQKQQIRHSQFVVLDVRGNLGGDTAYAHRIAMAIYGKAYVSPAIGWPYIDVINQEAIRVSKNNLAQVKGYLDKGLADYPDNVDAIKRLQYNYDRMKSAFDNNLALAPDVALKDRQVLRLGPAKDVAPAFNGQVLLLTDGACFSSCLLMTDLFLRIGAKQVGRTTNYMPRYYDTKTSLLPSKLSQFVTPIKVDFSSPAIIGPFKPIYTFEGNMQDTAHLQRWILDLVASDRD